MPLNVGQLQATMDLDISKFTKNMNSAKSQINSVGGTVNSDLTGAMDDASKSTERFADSIDEVSSSQRNMQTEVTNATSDIKDQKTEIEKTKDATEDLEGAFGKIPKVLSALKGMLGALGILAVVKQVYESVRDYIEDIKKRIQEARDLEAELTKTTGSSIVSNEMQLLGREAMKGSSRQLFTAEQYATNLTLFNSKTGGNLSDSELIRTSEEALFAARQWNEDASKLSDAMVTLFKKWEVPAQQWADEITFLTNLSQKYGLNISSLVSELTNTDNTFKSLDKSIEDSAVIIGKTYQSTNTMNAITSLSDAVDSIDAALVKYNASLEDASMELSTEVISNIKKRAIEILSEYGPDNSAGAMQAIYTEMPYLKNISGFKEAVENIDISAMMDSTKISTDIADIKKMVLDYTITKEEQEALKTSYQSAKLDVGLMTSDNVELTASNVVNSSGDMNSLLGGAGDTVNALRDIATRFGDGSQLTAADTEFLNTLKTYLDQQPGYAEILKVIGTAESNSLVNYLMSDNFTSTLQGLKVEQTISLVVQPADIVIENNTKNDLFARQRNSWDVSIASQNDPVISR